MNVSKGDLINQLAGVCGLTPHDSKNGIDAILSLIKDSAAAGNKVIIQGFGTFEMKTRAARTARNPGTGLPVEVPEKTTLTFKASKPKA